MRVERDGIYVAIASKGGADDQPEWYYNFVENPEVDLQDGATKKTYRAEIVHGEERADLWELAVSTWSTYARVPEEDRAGDPRLQAHPDRLNPCANPQNVRFRGFRPT